jgi:hypothetical protein
MSFHLQSLAGPEYYSQVKDAVEQKDRNKLLLVCRKAKIPAIYLSAIVSVLLSMGTEQPKWPSIV